MCSNSTSDVGQYADAFESYLAQLEDYDESFYLMKFIFGLRPTILTEVFMKRLATLFEGKCEINAAHDDGKKPTPLRLGLGTILIFSTLGSTWVART